MEPKDYERAIVRKFRAEFPPPMFRVEPSGEEDFKLLGAVTGKPRQIDCAVFRADEARPFLIADAKRWKDPLDVMDVERFLGFLPEVGPCIAILVVTDGFSTTSYRRAAGDRASVQLEVVTVEQALAGDWLAEARKVFPQDWAFHPEICRALRLLRAGAASDIAESVEGIAFEEWDALASWALHHHAVEAVSFLTWIASHHDDDGWRFNAARHLASVGLLTAELRTRVMDAESDPEARAVIAEM